MFGELRISLCLIIAPILAAMFFGACAKDNRGITEATAEIPDAVPIEPLNAGEVRVFEGSEFAWIPPGSFEMGAKVTQDVIYWYYGSEKLWKKSVRMSSLNIMSS